MGVNHANSYLSRHDHPFYVDNYKCLANFEYKPKPFELIIGTNGSGKTTVFEALDKVRQFVSGKTDAREIFRPQYGTKWMSKPTQTFELAFMHQGVEFNYRLELDLSDTDFRVEKEILVAGEDVICESEWRDRPQNGTSTLFDDEFDESDPFSDSEHANQVRVVVRGRKMPAFLLSDPNSSMLSARWMGLRDINSSLSGSQIVRINPFAMDSQVGKPQPRPRNDMVDFPSYYLYLLQQRQGLMFDMIPHLRSAIEGFDSFVVEEDFEAGRRELNVAIKYGRSKATPYDLKELSDGQRALIVLYTLVFCALDSSTSLVIDEPENYIALRELQPLIRLMEQRVEETGGQILLISHSREFINLLSDEGKCVRFYRENGGHTRVAEFSPDYEQTGLTGGEIVARGLEGDEK